MVYIVKSLKHASQPRGGVKFDNIENFITSGSNLTMIYFIDQRNNAVCRIDNQLIDNQLINQLI